VNGGELSTFVSGALGLTLLLLALSLLLGLVRVLKGPSLEDRLLSVLLLGSGGVGLLLLLSVSMQLTALIDVALVLALLAAVTAAALTRRGSDHG
jgi:multicomponent Na+:H+ antiporter subunit F